MRWFLPKNHDFLELFDQASANVVRGATLFTEILRDPRDRDAKVEQLKEIEHEGDRITHRTFATLNTSFITPYDREDIHTLASRLDDVLDLTHATAQRLRIYKLDEVPPRLIALGELLLAATKEAQKAVVALHERKRQIEAITACVEINRIENEADVAHREALAELFSGKPDPIELIKLKELYALLEDATDRCEDVANVVETILLKNS